MAFDLDGRPFWKKHLGCIALTLIGLTLVGVTIFLLTYRYEETLTLGEFLQKNPTGNKSHLTNESIIDNLNLMLLHVPEDRVKVWEKHTELTRHNLAYKKWIEEMDVVFSVNVSEDTIRKIMRDPFLTTTDHTK